TDPITFVTEDLGWYALVVNANDLAVRGAVPRWFLATCLFPAEGATAADVEALFAELGAGCAELCVALGGGHTEITAGLSRPIVVGAMLGEVAKDRLVTTAGARPGDVLLLTKGVPIEGASIIARARAAELRARGYADAWLARARDARTRLSVLPQARLATDLVPVHALPRVRAGPAGHDCLRRAAAGGRPRGRRHPAPRPRAGGDRRRVHRASRP